MSLTAQPSTMMQQQGASYQIFPSFLRSSTKIPPPQFWPAKKKTPEIIRPPVHTRPCPSNPSTHVCPCSTVPAETYAARFYSFMESIFLTEAQRQEPSISSCHPNAPYAARDQVEMKDIFGPGTGFSPPALSSLHDSTSTSPQPSALL